MKYNELDLQKIREVPIFDVCSKLGITLKGKGKLTKRTLCWHHDDKHPSMRVNKEKNLYKCFVCGRRWGTGVSGLPSDVVTILVADGAWGLSRLFANQLVFTCNPTGLQLKSTWNSKHSQLSRFSSAIYPCFCRKTYFYLFVSKYSRTFAAEYETVKCNQ